MGGNGTGIKDYGQVFCGGCSIVCQLRRLMHNSLTHASFSQGRSAMVLRFRWNTYKNPRAPRGKRISQQVPLDPRWSGAIVKICSIEELSPAFLQAVRMWCISRLPKRRQDGKALAAGIESAGHNWMAELQRVRYVFKALPDICLNHSRTDIGASYAGATCISRSSTKTETDVVPDVWQTDIQDDPQSRRRDGGVALSGSTALLSARHSWSISRDTI